jgi:hypothetical protein
MNVRLYELAFSFCITADFSRFPERSDPGFVGLRILKSSEFGSLYVDHALSS